MQPKRKQRQQPYLFYERLQEAINKRGLNCVQLGRMVGKDRKTIYTYKNGDCLPDALTLAKLCMALNVSADYLLGIKKNER